MHLYLFHADELDEDYITSIRTTSGHRVSMPSRMVFPRWCVVLWHGDFWHLHCKPERIDDPDYYITGYSLTGTRDGRVPACRAAVYDYLRTVNPTRQSREDVERDVLTLVNRHRGLCAPPHASVPITDWGQVVAHVTAYPTSHVAKDLVHGDDVVYVNIVDTSDYIAPNGTVVT